NLGKKENKKQGYNIKIKGRKQRLSYPKDHKRSPPLSSTSTCDDIANLSVNYLEDC
ncbi:unnamed protein product, partial [Arabidopsis halleri]